MRLGGMGVAARSRVAVLGHRKIAAIRNGERQIVVDARVEIDDVDHEAIDRLLSLFDVGRGRPVKIFFVNRGHAVRRIGPEPTGRRRLYSRYQATRQRASLAAPAPGPKSPALKSNSEWCKRTRHPRSQDQAS